MRKLPLVTLAACTIMGGVATSARADTVGVGSCSVSTYYTGYTCTFVPTATAIWFNCQAINGGIGTITVTQDVSPTRSRARRTPGHGPSYRAYR